MSKAPKTEKLFIEGPAGRLEALLESPPDGAVTGNAVICHPHPQHGGTLQNKVTHTLARAFLGQGFESLRFNFRGVGRSEGSFDEGNGEVDDALAAVAIMRSRNSGKPLWIGGFSFGAAIAVAAAASAGADGLVSVAPAISRVSRGNSVPECPWLIVQGDQDDLVDVDDTIAWVNELPPGPQLVIFTETEHFFHGKLVALRNAVEEFIGAQGAS